MKKTVDHFLIRHFSKYMKEPEYGLYPFNMSYSSDRAYTLIRDVPDDFDPRAELLSQLKAQQTKATADYEMLMNTPNGKIQQFLAIDHKVE